MDDFLDHITSLTGCDVATNDNKKVTFNDLIQERTMSSRYSNNSMSLNASLDLMESINNGIDDLDDSFNADLGDNEFFKLDRPEFRFQEPDLSTSLESEAPICRNVNNTSLNDTLDSKDKDSNSGFPVTFDNTPTIKELENQSETINVNRMSNVELYSMNESRTSERYFMAEPPSSLFEFDPHSIQENGKAPGKSIESEDVTPQEHKIRDANLVPGSISTAVPHTPRNWQGISETPKKDVDPFLDAETTVKASRVFHIKTPIVNPFKGFLSDETRMEQTQETPIGFNEWIDSRADISKESNPYDFANPFAYYSDADESDDGSNRIDDFEELKSKFISQESQILGALIAEEEEFKPANELFGDDLEELEGSSHQRRPSFLSASSHEKANAELPNDCATNPEPTQTPQTSRTMISVNNSADLFSPGNFFASRSGNLGQLGAQAIREAGPAWNTPHKDDQGRLIDSIIPTPAERAEKKKTAETPAGKRTVRKPLYEDGEVEGTNFEKSDVTTNSKSEVVEQGISISYTKNKDLELAMPSLQQFSNITQLDEPVAIAAEPQSVEHFVFNPSQYSNLNDDIDIPEDIPQLKSPINTKVVKATVPPVQRQSHKYSVSYVDDMFSDFAMSSLQQRSDELQNDENLRPHNPADLDLTGGFSETQSQRLSNSSNMKTITALNEWTVVQIPRDNLEFGPINISFYSAKMKPISRKLQIINRGSQRIVWSIAQIGSVKVKKEYDSYSIPDDVFKFDCSKGALEPGDSKLVSLSFNPIFPALYTVLFQLRAGGTIIDLHMEGKTCEVEVDFNQCRPPVVSDIDPSNMRHSVSLSTRSTKSSSTIKNEATPSINKITKNQKSDLEDYISVLQSSFRSQSAHNSDYDELDKSLGNFMVTPKKHPLIDLRSNAKGNEDTIGIKTQTLLSPTPSLKNSTVPPDLFVLPLTPNVYSYQATQLMPETSYREKTRLNDLIDFGKIRLGQSKTIQIKVNNVDTRNIKVRFAVTGPLIIPIREMMMTSRSYVVLPLMLKSSQLGPVNERLLIEKNSQIRRIHIVGNIINT